jgi:hypothetical protein
MQSLWNILVTTLRAKITPLWIKVRMLFSPSVIKSKVLIKIRDFFNKLFDVRPRDQQDYYPVFRYLVSKRLAFALVVALGLLSVMYIYTMLPSNLLKSSSTSIPTYRYRSIPLKFYDGTVNILAKDGYLAYQGEVKDGAASGTGTLYGPDGQTVYEGQFENSMYNGTGTLYYDNGIPEYVGEFVNNVYSGNGTSYRPNGVKEYSGDFLDWERSGSGTLYNSVGDKVYEGNFLGGELLYQDFLARPTTEVSSLYSGETAVYQSDTEYCVAMPEIDAVYSVKDGSNTLENEWTVERVYVLHDSVLLENGACGTLRQLMSELGEPLYFGTAWVNLPETIAWNTLAEEQSDYMESVTIETQASLDNVFAVSAYDRDFEMYLYTFEQSGLLYTFYFTQAGESSFVMYAIEKS